MMAKSNRSNRNVRGVLDIARERPIAAAATAVGAAATGLFLWSKRAQISDRLSSLNDQFSQWTESMRATGDDFVASSGTTQSGGGNASPSATRRPAARRKTAPTETVVID
jgi:hypothetical protein